MARLVWLALGYNVPVNPSKNRVYVWRKLKEYGAGYFKQGVALLPASAQSMAKLRQLAAKIKEMGGEATIAELKFCDARDEAETIERFRSQSDSEYLDLLRDCAMIMESLTENLRRDHLKKVMRRYKQAQSRDYFKAGAQGKTKSALEELAADIGELF